MTTINPEEELATRLNDKYYLVEASSVGPRGRTQIPWRNLGFSEEIEKEMDKVHQRGFYILTHGDILRKFDTMRKNAIRKIHEKAFLVDGKYFVARDSIEEVVEAFEQVREDWSKYVNQTDIDSLQAEQYKEHEKSMKKVVESFESDPVKALEIEDKILRHIKNHMPTSAEIRKSTFAVQPYQLNLSMNPNTPDSIKAFMSPRIEEEARSIDRNIKLTITSELADAFSGLLKSDDPAKAATDKSVSLRRIADRASEHNITGDPIVEQASEILKKMVNSPSVNGPERSEMKQVYAQLQLKKNLLASIAERNVQQGVAVEDPNDFAKAAGPGITLDL